MSTELLRWLSRIDTGPRTGRKRSWYGVAAVARRLDLLQPAPRVVVVAGTNGKGTTVCYIEQLLVARGIVVGSTYSPHLQRFNERIRVSGQNVSDDEIVSAFEVIHAKQDDVYLSYHDYATLAGLWIFKQHRVDFAVLEVGVGGRYDATNVVRRDVNVITSVALDHQDMLGLDRDTIGWEKAGISQCGVPLICGDLDLVPTVSGRARTLNSPLIQRGTDFNYHLHNQAQVSIFIKQAANMHTYTVPSVPKYPLSLTLAIQVLVTLGFNVSDSDLIRTDTMRVPGRMELIHHLDRDWLLDVAHNPDAIKYLMQSLPTLTDKKVAKVLLGTLKNKDFFGIMNALSLPLDCVVVTATQGRRGATWKTQCTDLGIQCVESMDFAYQELVTTTVSGDLILVVGSVDVVGRFRAKVTS